MHLSNIPSIALVASLLAGADARLVTIQETTTAAPTTVVQSQEPTVVTNQQTQWVSETIFKASTIVTTIPTGSVNTEPVSSKSNPVSQASSYSTTELSYSIDPSSYSSGGFTIVNPTPSVSSSEPTASASSSASSTPTIAPTEDLTSTGPSASSAPTSSPSSSSITTSGASSSSSSSAPSSSGSYSSSVGSSSSISSSSVPITTSPTGYSGSSTSSSSAASSSSAVSSSSAASSSSTISSSSSSTSSVSDSAATAYSGPIFDPVSTDEPLEMFSREPIPLKLPSNFDTSQIVQTNKFYDNLLLGDQDLTVFAQPYDMFYSTDENNYGWGVSYTNASQRVFGPDPSANPVEYYTNPLMLKSLVFTAKEFTTSDMTPPVVTDMGPFSVNVTLGTYNKYSNQAITIPISIGMGFVTAIYDGYTPRFFSQIGIDQIVKSKSSNCADSIQKFVFSLMNGMQWNVYVQAPEGFQFKAVSDYEVIGNFAASGSDSIVIQAAIIEGNEDAIDSAAGAYPVGASIDGETSGSSTTYRIEYDVAGSSKSNTTLLYALPHHVSSFSSTSKDAIVSDLTTYASDKGYLTGVLSNTLEMVEDVSDIPGWLTGDRSVLTSDTMKLLATVVNQELSEDIKGQTDTTSTYTAGKSFDKFAYILLVASEILQDDNVTKEGLDRLKAALDPWLSNTQPTPFIYDTLCKGVTSSGAQNGGNPMNDYGAPFYNDHHFHYGYYVHTAAVIALLDKKVGDGTWLEKNKDWVNSLVRDVANPSTEDSHFPVSRMFDYFHGHSWAAGMFVSGDGKNEESTSEDYNFAYGMKLWGQVSGDSQMEARGDLMLAILKRSMNDYFLFKNDNSIQPSNIIGNRVAGISFENKLDHTTYFGTKLEYIQGIQMIPLTPASVLIREKEFVQQEWDSLISNIVDNADGGWAGILRANQALIDPSASYDYFASSSFSDQYLDGGASRSWYLAFAALLGGSS